jgi:hypothetical protein
VKPKANISLNPSLLPTMEQQIIPSTPLLEQKVLAIACCCYYMGTMIGVVGAINHIILLQGLSV